MLAVVFKLLLVKLCTYNLLTYQIIDEYSRYSVSHFDLKLCQVCNLFETKIVYCKV